MSSNVFQVLQAFLCDSGIAKLFHGFLWKMLEDVLESVELSNVFPGKRDIYNIMTIVRNLLKLHNAFQRLLPQKPASSGMPSNVFQVSQAFVLRESGFVKVFPPNPSSPRTMLRRCFTHKIITAMFSVLCELLINMCSTLFRGEGV